MTLRRLIASVTIFLATSQGEAAVTLSLAVLFRTATEQTLFFMRDVNWYLLLDIHRVRDRDGLRDVHWVRFWNLNMVRHGVRYLDRDLNLVRYFLLDGVWDLFLHHYGVGLRYLHRIGLRDGHVNRDFDFIGDSLLYGDCIGLGYRVWHFLGDYDGPHVLLLVFLLFTSV